MKNFQNTTGQIMNENIKKNFGVSKLTIEKNKVSKSFPYSPTINFKDSSI